MRTADTKPNSRWLLAVMGAAALGMPTVVAPAWSSPASTADVHPARTGASPEITDLGVAMREVNVRLADVGVLSDGTPVGYIFSDGEPISFNVVDLRTGEVLDSHLMDGYAMASSITVADDGTVYLSVRDPNDGTLWRYDPADREMSQLATGVAGEDILRAFHIDGDTLYGTTYPNAGFYSMDLTTNQITEYGRVAPQGDYAWGLDMYDGELLVGAGTPAQLFSLDPETGEATTLELPEEVAADGEVIQRIETYGDNFVVGHRDVNGTRVQVHDGTDWIDALPVFGMWHYTEQMADGRFFYIGSDSQLWAYDVDAHESQLIDLAGSGIENELAGTSQMFLADLGTSDFPGMTVIGVRTDGRFWRYNLTTGTADTVSRQLQGSPVSIVSIGEGGDGQVYLGGYAGPNVMARVDPATNELAQIDGPVQADSIIAHGSQTVVGTYPEAQFYVAAPDEPWRWGDNPRHVLTLGHESGQDRPRHMISAGDVVAAGTIPDYGQLGGALTLFDAETGEHEMHRNVVPDQSVTDLAYADGVVYGGTSIYGGLSTEPTQTTAELFAWDVDDGLIASGPTVEGAEIIHSLTVDSEGRLWGMADNGVLFEYDTGNHEVVRSIATGIQHRSAWGSSSELDYNPADGLIYGSAGDRLFSFDPDDPDVRTLVSSGVQRSTVAAGNIYYTDDTHVFMLEVSGEVTWDSVRDRVDEMHDEGLIHRGVAWRLHAHLSTAQRFADRGDTTNAARSLDRAASVTQDVDDADTRTELGSLLDTLRQQL